MHLLDNKLCLFVIFLHLRWEDNIKMDFQKMECGGTDWIELVRDREKADTCDCGNETSGSKKCGEFD